LNLLCCSIHSNRSHEDLRIIGAGRGYSDGDEDPLEDGEGDMDNPGIIGEDMYELEGDEGEFEAVRAGRSKGE
jgi:hypothetical protein